MTKKIALSGLLLVITVVVLVWLRPISTGAGTLTGTLRVESEPGGAAVAVDGKSSGTTPVSLMLSPGKHHLVVRRGERSQELAVTIERNVSTVHHITWSSETLSGSLRVISDVGAGRVSVDGVDRGTTPLTIDGLTPGDHQVVVRNGAEVQRRSIRIEGGGTASLVISPTPPGKGVESGWLAVRTDAPLQVVEDGKVIGTTESDTIMLPAGEHSFEFVNAALGFSTTRRVKIIIGQTQKVGIELPRTSISVNATPWAEVWLDGQRVGDTPIGNLSAVIGSHELVFRHPQLGERRVSALVTLKEPARVAVDMRKSQ